MTGMIVPTVRIVDAPVPAWVPDAIRRMRRRPLGTPLSWPADVPDAVLAVRLGRDGSSQLRPWTNEFALVVMIDGDENNGVAALPFPTAWVAATGLTPGRHTFTARLGADPEDGEDDANVQPVTLDIRPGTLVYVEGTPQPDGRPGVVSFHVVPSGLAHRAVKAAMTRRVSKGSVLERVANGFLAKVDFDESEPAVPDEPAPDPVAVRTQLVESLASRTWVGTARRRPAAMMWLGGFAMAAAVYMAITLAVGRDELSSLPFVLAGMAGLGALLALAMVLLVRPITLTVDGRGISMTQGRTRASAALADLDWAHSTLEEDEVVLAVRPDPLTGPRPAIAVNMPGFTKEQRGEIRAVLRHASDAYASLPARPTVGNAAWMGVTPQRTWVSRSGFLVQAVMWALYALVFLMVAGGMQEEAGIDIFSLGMWSVVVWVVALVVAAGVVVLNIRSFGRVKVTIDPDGVTIERRWRPVAIAHRDIKSVSLNHTGDPGVSVGYNADMASLEIEPKRAYLTRTGMKRGGARWKLSQERFRKADLEEMAAFLGQGVEAAGGHYYRG